MCGRRKMERLYPDWDMDYGDITLGLLCKIATQLPLGITVQFHWNGEPTMYPNLGNALALFSNRIRQFDTNGKLLVEKAPEIIGNLEVLTISVIESDPEGDAQYETVRKFIEIKNSEPPRMVYRLLGNVDKAPRWHGLPGIVAPRILHDPMGSMKYTHPVTIPETGICQDFLTRLSIDRNGHVSPCPRFDPEGKGVIGDINYENLEDIWNGQKRRHQKQLHVSGRRDDIPLCKTCEYWGLPSGGDA